MPSTIREINSTWLSYNPSGLTTVAISQVGNEAQIRWGVPVTGKAGLGFAGTSPPAQDQALQAEFVLGTLTHYNFTIAEEAVSDATVQLEFIFGNLSTSLVSLTFSVTETPDEGEAPATNDVIASGTSFPFTVTAGGAELEVLGFREVGGSDIVSQFSSPEGAANPVELIGRLLATTEEEAHCVPGEFIPVFNPDKCVVPSVCPISEEPIIADCIIPEAPEPLTDCPEIDIPMGVGSSLPGVNSGSCTPEVTTSFEIRTVSDCAQQAIQVASFKVPPCNTHLHFIFTLCQTYGDSNDCCSFQCCAGVWSLVDGGNNCQAAARPTTSTTNSGNDLWYFSPGGTPWIYPPPSTSGCTYEGQLLVLCPCEYNTTTTTPKPCILVDCPGGSAESCANVTVTGCNCSFDGEALYDGTCWTRTIPGSGFCHDLAAKLCCDGGFWTIELGCRGDLEILIDTEVIDLGDTFQVIGHLPADSYTLDCCNGEVNIVFTLTKCQATTTTCAPAGFDCEWEWQGPEIRWVVVTTSICPDCECLIEPPRDGDYLGELVFTTCEYL